MFKLKRIWILLLFPIALVLSILARESAAFAEFYAVNIYPYISKPVNYLTSKLPFSLGEFMIPVAVILGIGLIVFYIFLLCKGVEKKKEYLVKFVLTVLCILCIVFFDFTVSCGINYHRYTFAQRYNYNLEPSSKEDLVGLCIELVNKANQLRENIIDDETEKLEDFSKMAQTAVESYNKMAEIYPTLKTKYTAPKPIFFSKFMSKLNLTGIFFSGTFEANVNIDSPAFLIPSTMCHELSHVQGYMREDEANYIAYLVCSLSDDDYFKYSGTMIAYIHSVNALYAVDTEAYFEIFKLLDDKVLEDITINNAYWQGFKGKTAEVSKKVNDTYLKINSLEDGVKSYGRMVDLLIADYKNDKLNN